MDFHNLKLKDLLIEIENEYDDFDNITFNKNNNIEFDDNDSNKTPMYLIRNEYTNPDDPDISQFITFCISQGLFDNTFYDIHNTFSVVATKLPVTFEKLSKDGTDINKKTFISKFKKDFGYNGNIHFIYNCLDSKKKGFITWDDFVDFFLPYIQYITV